MLFFQDSQDQDLILRAMRSVLDKEDYFQQILFPALLRGDWDELEKMVVYQDKKRSFILRMIYGCFPKLIIKAKMLQTFILILKKIKVITSLDFGMPRVI